MKRRVALIVVICELMLAGCASGVDMIQIPRAEFAYSFGSLSRVLKEACLQGRLDTAVCGELASTESYLKKHLFDRSEKQFDMDQFMKLIGVAAKLAI